MAVGTTLTAALLKFINEGKETLKQPYLAGVYVRRAGNLYTNYREKNYIYAVGNNNYAYDVTQAHVGMEKWQPMYVPSTKKSNLDSTDAGSNRSVPGEAHVADGDEKEHFFDCDRFGHVRKN